MSNEAPVDDEVAARVRATVAGDFQPEHVDGFPMRPDKGSIDLVGSSTTRGFDSRFSSIFLKTCFHSRRAQSTFDLPSPRYRRTRSIVISGESPQKSRNPQWT